MSERSSFVTEFIYCEQCLIQARQILRGQQKSFCCEQLRSWQGEGVFLPILAGKIGGLHPATQLLKMGELMDVLANVLCCPMRVAMLADDGNSYMYFLFPGGEVEAVQVRSTQPDLFLESKHNSEG